MMVEADKLRKLAEEKGVSPEALQAALLLRLIKETKTLTTLMESMIEEGIIEALDPKTVTTKRLLVRLPDYNKPWFGVKVTNDGPNSVWLIVNPTKTDSQPQEIKPNDTWGVQFKTAVINSLQLYTKSGTTTVRIRGER